MRSFVTLIGAAFLWAVVSLSAAIAQVGPAVETGHATSRLAAERLSAMPGETITIGFFQELEPGWHVYWRNPGDTGLPLTLEWEMPDGFVASDIHYPLPERLPVGPLVNYGHKGSPIFLVDIDVPADAQPGDAALLSVAARWLICEEICVPEEADLRLSLPITEAAGGSTPRFSGRIAEARETQPGPAGFETSYFEDGAGGLVLKLNNSTTEVVHFFPDTPSVIEAAAPVPVAQREGGLLLGLTPSFAYEDIAGAPLTGVVTVGEGSARRGFEIAAVPVDRPADFTPIVDDRLSAVGSGAAPARQGLFVTFALALLGGLLLNVMPCVFPIIFMKAAGFASAAAHDRQVIRLHGLLYTAGILSAFAALAVLLMILRAQGEAVGWGFHLQSPVAVGLFALIIFLVGLNFSGVFEVGQSAQGVGQSLAAQGGARGAFFTGLLAVAVAAPCVGPFLGGALGLALTQPPLVGAAIFLAIGMGLALPYLVFSFLPQAARWLPKPGPWLETLKQLFAFALYLTVVWLAWVISQQAGSAGVLRLGVALVMAGFAAWVFGRSQMASSQSIPARVAASVALLIAVLAAAQMRPDLSARPTAEATDGLTATTYSAAALSAARAGGTPVFVDFTAAWCITCQVNKRTVLNHPQVQDAFAAANATYMVADWTLQDPEITEALEAYGRAGVPLYLYFSPGAAQAEVLPQLLSLDRVLSLFQTGGGEKDPSS